VVFPLPLSPASVKISGLATPIRNEASLTATSRTREKPPPRMNRLVNCSTESSVDSPLSTSRLPVQKARHVMPGSASNSPGSSVLHTSIAWGTRVESAPLGRLASEVGPRRAHFVRLVADARERPDEVTGVRVQGLPNTSAVEASSTICPAYMMASLSARFACTAMSWSPG